MTTYDNIRLSNSIRLERFASFQIQKMMEYFNLQSTSSHNKALSKIQYQIDENIVE